MAHFTQKNFYDNNSQQDSVEFLEDLEAALYNEIGLNGVRDAHWGSEELTRHFSGNEDGRCLKGHMPVSMNQEFLFLKLRLNDGNSKVTIQRLIDLHFSSNLDIEQIKCAQCCQCSKITPPIVSTFSGDCKKNTAIEKCVYTLFPKYLFTQLIRWDNIGEKKEQFVQIDKELFISDSCTYQPIAIISHEGSSKDSGHYITHRKNIINDEWILCNDDKITRSSLIEANSKNNYVILFLRVENVVPPDSLVRDSELIDNVVKNCNEKMPVKDLPLKCKGCPKVFKSLGFFWTLK